MKIHPHKQLSSKVMYLILFLLGWWISHFISARERSSMAKIFLCVAKVAVAVKIMYFAFFIKLLSSTTLAYEGLNALFESWEARPLKTNKKLEAFSKIIKFLVHLSSQYKQNFVLLMFYKTHDQWDFKWQDQILNCVHKRSGSMCGTSIIPLFDG